MPKFSDLIVYADESGDHGMVKIDSSYPIFALIFCVMHKEKYVDTIVPAVQKFKFSIWGHDSIILHENEIRKKVGPIGILHADTNLHTQFMEKLSALIESVPMTILATVIDKRKLQEKYGDPRNPYKLALYFCMKQLRMMLVEENQQGNTVHVVFESRGRKEDIDLTSEFWSIIKNESDIENNSANFKIFDFQPVFIPKSSNSPGLLSNDTYIFTGLGDTYLRRAMAQIFRG